MIKKVKRISINNSQKEKIFTFFILNTKFYIYIYTHTYTHTHCHSLKRLLKNS